MMALSVGVTMPPTMPPITRIGVSIASAAPFSACQNSDQLGRPALG